MTSLYREEGAAAGTGPLTATAEAVPWDIAETAPHGHLYRKKNSTDEEAPGKAQ